MSLMTWRSCDNIFGIEIMLQTLGLNFTHMRKREGQLSIIWGTIMLFWKNNFSLRWSPKQQRRKTSRRVFRFTILAQGVDYQLDSSTFFELLFLFFFFSTLFVLLLFSCSIWVWPLSPNFLLFYRLKMFWFRSLFSFCSCFFFFLYI